MTAKKLLLLLTILVSSSACSLRAQLVKHERLLSFEEADIPPFLIAQHSSVGLDATHFRDGKQSLAWEFEPGGVLSIHRPLMFEPKDPTGKDTYLSAFIVWIHNEQAIDRQLEFRFLKDGRVCSSFAMGLNFTGWRGAWVCYERDMQGTPESGMNEIQLLAPADASGKLYIDHLLTAAKVDARQQTPDVQLPFVNRGTTNHWLVLYYNSLLQPTIPLEELTDTLRADMTLMEQRFRQMLYAPSVLTEKELRQIRERFAYYQIRRDAEGRINGLPIWFVRHSEAYERLLADWDKDFFTRQGVEMNEYFNLMRRVATAYLNASADSPAKEELRRMFLDLYDNITDQGVAYGSCWGNCHHYGYSMRGMFVSYFLMKPVLRETGRLDAAGQTLLWYANTREVFPQPMVNGIDIDTFNTKLQGRMASILLMEDSPEKLQYLRSLVRWLDYGCRPAPGLSGSFKSDGACFHHCNNYPAYAVGGLDGATDMIYLLSGTAFRLSELAHATVRNVLLTMRFYCNLQQWPLAMSGRHPNGSGRLIPKHYATMALAGTPDGLQPVDEEMARAYLRLADSPESKKLTPQERQMRRLLEASGYRPESDPQGNIALGYGCVSVHRRDHWMAVVRGHSRYLWAAEHYLGANYYGRYLAHGSMQLLTGPEDHPVSLQTSGWKQEGFDWNRIPGTTTIHLPFEQLRANVLNVDTCSGMEEMLYSDEAFAGGLSQGRMNGNFGMKLHEHDKYNGSHRARKSYHFFDRLIVCLGTGIENDNNDYPTETTLFQLTVDSAQRTLWAGYTGKEQTYLDANGVGYFLPQWAKGKVRFERHYPQVTVGERSTEPTRGDWVSLTWQHGRSPKHASYEYAVLPHTDIRQLKAFAKKPPYRLLQQDDKAHIVMVPTLRTTSYVLFESSAQLPAEGLLQQTDTACLVMVKEEADRVLLSVAQPDLALYRSPSDEAFDAAGKRIERSIYSRPWTANESQVVPVTLTLKGTWQASGSSACHVISAQQGVTVLCFDCKDGAGIEVQLQKW